MSKIQRFEEIKAWQLARQVVRKIYALSRKSAFSGDFGFKDQIRRAAVSVMSNIAEGFERYGVKEFIQFLNISRGSIAEVRSQLYVALDLNYITNEEFADIKDDCESISRHIWNFMKYLKTSSKVS